MWALAYFFKGNFTTMIKHIVFIIIFLVVSSDVSAQQNINAAKMVSKNSRISFVGSSVTWGDGFLQSGLVREAILNIQRKQSTTIAPNMVIVKGDSNYLTGVDNRKYFGGEAIKITGVNSSIKFSIIGDEISIVQGIERNNDNAAEIELYMDGSPYASFNNWNISEIGIDNKTFLGDGGVNQFDLGRAFTFGHQIFLNNKLLRGAHHTGGYGGGKIPGNLDYIIIRKYSKDKSGNPEVHHWVSLKKAPQKADRLTVSFSYGEEISYEKTTIGKSAEGKLESPFGDGDISFDITKPTSISSGLDYRQTDDRAVKTYKFASNRKREVELRIKGNYKGAKGIPYFIFNFATNRFFSFQNAGIGGWKLSFFNNPDEYHRGYKKIVEFSPDVLYMETTPNDDWNIKGYKLYTRYTNLSLQELQSIRTLPIKTIKYNTEADTYDFEKWVGKIRDITPNSVSFLADEQHKMDVPPKQGDFVFIGAYYSNNREYAVRKVQNYDPVSHQIFFDKPLITSELLYKNIEVLKGMEVRVRSFSAFEKEMKEFTVNIRKFLPQVKMATIVNPLPVIGTRELWGYWDLMNNIAKEIKIENLQIAPFYDYQYTQHRDKQLVLNALALKKNQLTGYMEAKISGFDGKNHQNYEVLVGGKDVYGKDALVRNPHAYGVDFDLQKSQLNMDYLINGVRAKQKINQSMELVFLKNAPTSGEIHLRFSGKNWSEDGCHVRTGDNGSKLYGDIYYEYFSKINGMPRTNKKF